MAYGFRAHLMNLGVYSLGLIPLTILITHIEPGTYFNGTQPGPFDNKVFIDSLLIVGMKDGSISHSETG